MAARIYSAKKSTNDARSNSNYSSTQTMTTDSADRALSQPSPEISATGALTDIQLWELLPKRLEQNLLAMVQIAAPHHNLRPIDLLQNIAPDFVDYARAVLKAEPQAERPSEKDLYDLAAEFDGDPVPAMRRALELWGPLQQVTPAPGENLATPPAPAPKAEPTDDAWWHELINEIARVQHVAAGLGQGGQVDLAEAVKLWCHPATPPAPVAVPVSERLRGVRAGIRAGYNLGHHHTVEGGWGDPDEVADDIAQETLDDIGLPPAPQCLVARMADELDRLQPLPAFPPITSHPLAIEARALLRGGTTTIPAPQVGEVAVPEPVAELDDQRRGAVHQAVAEALGSGAYDCLRVWEAWGVGTMGPDDFVPVAEDSDRVAEIADAAIDAIRAIPLPAPQAGEVEA
jgi:hypothetical protein